MASPFFLSNPDLQLLLFGGKGGVGKTTCAAATALHLAHRFPQSRFLLVSTDPAHSLSDSLAGFSPPANLNVLEFNSQECLARFKEQHGEKLRQIASRGTFLEEEDISQLLGLSLPGLDELMAFMEISRWAREARYHCQIVDTAPTGHTLRLLAMPELLRKWLKALDVLLAKHRYMKKIFQGFYRRDELDDFLEEWVLAVKNMEALLQDPTRCRFIPVLLAETASIRETAVLVDELERYQIPVIDLVVNRLVPERSCPVCAGAGARQREELRSFPEAEKLFGHVLWGVPFYPEEVRGREALMTFWNKVTEISPDSSPSPCAPREQPFRVEGAAKFPGPETALLLFAGKGGVGKTTLACATALRLAQDLPGKEVFLFSTDPAHSLSACLDLPVGPQPVRIAPGLTAMEVDARAEFTAFKKQYQKELHGFMEALRPNLDLAFDREVMEKVWDLSPPGVDEVMALNLAMEFLLQGRYDLFILDSAATGHLLRFLELPELVDRWLKVWFQLLLKYKRVLRLPRISQRLVRISKDLKQLSALLHDPTRSSLYGVSIFTEMAWEETKDLVEAAEGMGIHVPVLFLNQATAAAECSFCSAMARRETKVREKFHQTFSGQEQTIVFHQGSPRGLTRLKELGEALYQPRLKSTIPARLFKAEPQRRLGQFLGRGRAYA